jgi:hypothetical protein
MINDGGETEFNAGLKSRWKPSIPHVHKQLTLQEVREKYAELCNGSRQFLT